MSTRAAIIATLQRHRLTSYEVHSRLDDEVDISLANCCAVLGTLAKTGRIVRSKQKVHRRHRSPGAYEYSLPEDNTHG